MILDTSAIIAIVQEEPSFENLVDKMTRANLVGIGAPTLTETGLVLRARYGNLAESLLDEFLHIHLVQLIPFGEAHWREAVHAFARYGKGQHPAKLNFGDCLSYATTKIAGRPLLFTGNDFAQTDLEPA